MRIFTTFAALVAITLLSACSPAPSGRLQVFVSILPMEYFVARVGGEQVDISVLVGPGQSPETYEPLPRQMVVMGQTDIFFRIGAPFEDAWIGRIRENYPTLEIVDLRENISLIPMETFGEILARMAAAVDSTVLEESRPIGDSGPEEHGQKGLDPHIWLSPELVKTQAQTICDALSAEDPGNQEEYRANLAAFQADLDRLHDEIAAIFESLPDRTFLVYHPAWGYFAREFGLVQFPIEIEGKEPGPRQLAAIIDIVKREGLRVIYAQPQMTGPGAHAVAESIGGTVVQIDPLAEDYLTNLRTVAETIRANSGGARP